jgi:hypothetical protein
MGSLFEFLLLSYTILVLRAISTMRKLLLMIEEGMLTLSLRWNAIDSIVPIGICHTIFLEGIIKPGLTIWQ